jgi:hypothetical protein
LLRPNRVECELATIPVDLDDIARIDFLLQKSGRQRVGQSLLNDPFERPGAIGWIKSFFG